MKSVNPGQVHSSRKLTHSTRKLRKFRGLPVAAALLLSAGGAQSTTAFWSGGPGDWYDLVRIPNSPFLTPAWSTGRTPNDPLTDVAIDGRADISSSVKLTSWVSVGKVAVSEGDLLSIESGRLDVFGGRLDNSGTMQLVTSRDSLPGVIALKADTAIGGSGRTMLQGGVVSGGANKLTIENQQLILGYGSLSGSEIVNQGVLWSTAQITVIVGTNRNLDNRAGQVRIASGSSFYVNTPRLANSYDLGTPAPGSAVLGGTFTGEGSAVLGGNISYRDPTFIGQLKTDAPLFMQGTVTNDAVLSTYEKRESWGSIRLVDDTRLTGTGTVRLLKDNGIYISGHALTIDTGQTIVGSGALGEGHNTTITNLGRIQVSAGSTLHSWLGSGSTFDNRLGTIVMDEDSNLDISVSNGLIFGGNISTSTQASLALRGVVSGANLTGSFKTLGDRPILAGTLNILGSLDISNTGMAFKGDSILAGPGETWMGGNPLRSMILYDNTKLTIAANHKLRGNGTLSTHFFPYILSGGSLINMGTIRAEGGELTLGDIAVDNSQGAVEVRDGAGLILQGRRLTGGRIAGSGDANIAGTGVFDGVTFAGQLRVGPAQQLNLAGSVTNIGTLTIDGGTLQSNAHTLDNTSGTIVVMPGGAIYLTGPDSLILSDNSTLIFTGQEYSTGNGLPSDDFSPAMTVEAQETSGLGQLWSAGNMRLDGTLRIEFGNSMIHVGDQFTLIRADGQIIGSFDSVMADGYQVSLTRLGDGLSVTVLSISAVPEPDSTALLLTGGLVVAGIGRRRRASALR